jgi:hypothetical protein
MTLPRTPLEGKLPLFGARSAFLPKGWGACAQRPVDFAVYFHKSLMLERNHPTGCGVFSMCRAPTSTYRPISSTSAFLRFWRAISLYLSLFKKKRRRKYRAYKKSIIHGFEQLLKKASTGYNPIPRLTRGYPWMRFLITSKGYV